MESVLITYSEVGQKNFLYDKPDQKYYAQIMIVTVCAVYLPPFYTLYETPFLKIA